jgi:hypothetical protein
MDTVMSSKLQASASVSSESNKTVLSTLGLATAKYMVCTVCIITNSNVLCSMWHCRLFSMLILYL